MNYLHVYINLCRTRSNKMKSNDEYRESHHIFPVSIFGKNDKVVNLTAREHYIAHLLLFKICLKRYGEKHSYTKKMANALIMMINENEFVLRRYPSRYYETARNIWKKHWINPILNPKNRRYGKDNNMYKIGSKHPLYGTTRSDETKQKISIANKGKLIGDKNPSKRDDVKKKISESWKNREKIPRDKNKRTKISESQMFEILELWKKEKNNGMTGYRFCKIYHTIYNVKHSTIGNLIFKK